MKRSTLLFVLALAAAMPTVAHADEPTLDAAADARFKEGLAHAKQGRYEQARTSFLQTLALSPESPKVFLNLAISEHGTGRWLDALAHLKEYLARSKDAKADEVRNTLYQELWKRTAHLRIAAEPGAIIMLDGVNLGNAPLDEIVDVLPGSHHLGAGAGSIEIHAQPDVITDVAVPRPPSSMPVPPPTESHDQPSAARWIVPAGLGAVAVGALAMGIGFAAASRNAEDRANRLRGADGGASCDDLSSTSCHERREALEATTTHRTWSYASYAGGFVFGAAALGTYFFWPKGSTRVAPSAGRDSATLHIFGEF